MVRRLLEVVGMVAVGTVALAQIAACNGETAPSCKNPDPPVRQFSSIENVHFQPFAECDHGQCSDGQTCFTLTRELAVCDEAQLTPHSGNCSVPPAATGVTFECGCAGRACPAGLQCIEFEPTCSCAPGRSTMCAEPRCSTPSDCPAGTVCVPTSLVHSQPVGRAQARGNSLCLPAV